MQQISTEGKWTTNDWVGKVIRKVIQEILIWQYEQMVYA